MGIVDLREVTSDRREVAGGKAVGLGALLRAGEQVPPGFCITTEGGERAEILRAYERLGAGAVAVRSSATVEDAPDASYAGMFDTVLDVQGPAALLAAIDVCRASARGARVTAYGGTGVKMAVVVQQMVEAATGGVLFTADPVTGCRTAMLVESAKGGGETVVGGRTRVERRLLDHGDPMWAVGERLQRLFGSPQDIEWAIDPCGTRWILQSRPITALFPAPPTAPAAGRRLRPARPGRDASRARRPAVRADPDEPATRQRQASRRSRSPRGARRAGPSRPRPAPAERGDRTPPPGVRRRRPRADHG